MATSIGGPPVLGRKQRRKAALAALKGLHGRLKASCGPAMTANDWYGKVQDVRSFTGQWEDVLPAKTRSLLDAATARAEGASGDLQLACSALDKDLLGVIEAFPPVSGFGALPAPVQVALGVAGGLGLVGLAVLAIAGVMLARLLAADRVPLTVHYRCPTSLHVEFTMLGFGLISRDVEPNSTSTFDAPGVRYRVKRDAEGVAASASGVSASLPVASSVALALDGRDIPVGADTTADLGDGAPHALTVTCG